MLEEILLVLYGLILGSLIGVEREKENFEQKQKNFAGIRTFSLIAMFGALLSIIGNQIIILMGFLAVIAVMISAYFITNRPNDEDNIGITTEVAVLVVFIIGLLAGMGELVLSSAAAVITVLVLGGKEYIHKAAKKITSQELNSILKFIIISVVVLPLLPDEAIGPLDIINPYQIWFLVVLIAGTSALSYLGIKLIGYRKGIGVTGFLGGIVSSTAVTLSFSKLSKDLPKKTLSPILFGLLISSAAMYLRILLEVSIVNSKMFWPLFLPLTLSALCLSGFGFYFYRRKKDEDYKIKQEDFGLKNPVDIWAAVKFGGLFALILVLVSLADIYIGEGGLLIASAISGMADTDAISLSLASLAKTSISLETASLGVLLASAGNIFCKSLLVVFLGSKHIRSRFLLVVGCNYLILIGTALWWIL